jgi:DNA-binding MarR family transcriptional regulator
VPESQPEESLGEEFWTVARRLRHRSVEALSAWELAPSHARALGVIAEAPIRLSSLAERLRVAPRTVTEVVDALVDRELVERRRDPDDRRATLVALTESGRDATAAIGRARADNAAEFFSVLSKSDRAELIRILRLLG